MFFGELVPLFFIVALPLSVHAGFFSSLRDMLNSNVVIAQQHQEDLSIQDIKLLSATNNPDPIGALGGGDIIIDEGVLIAGGTLGEDEMNAAKTYSGNISIYTVRECQEGKICDTLSDIADMHDVSVNTILWANNIKNPNLIKPGDTLLILPISGVRHVVKSGDTLSSIVKKYHSDADSKDIDAITKDIIDYNQLVSDEGLSVGETLVIPGGEIAAPVRVASFPVQSSGLASGGSSTGFVHPAPGATKTQGIHGYNGVDLASYYGAPIKAAASGEVIVSKSGGWNGGYGNYVVIRHADGTQTLYAHMSSNAVGVGAYVATGEVIGAMGATGRSTGTHLHFEVRGARNPF